MEMLKYLGAQSPSYAQTENRRRTRLPKPTPAINYFARTPLPSISHIFNFILAAENTKIKNT